MALGNLRLGVRGLCDPGFARMVGSSPHSATPRVVSQFLSNGPCVFPWFETRKASTMASGTIKKVVSDRGFGFISGEGGKDYFFHRDNLVAPLDFDRLNGGEPVTYEVEESPKGPRAVRVTNA